MKKIIIKYTLLLLATHLIKEIFGKYILAEWSLYISELLHIYPNSSITILSLILHFLLGVLFAIIIYKDLLEINVKSNLVFVISLFSPLSGSTFVLIIHFLKYFERIKE